LYCGRCVRHWVLIHAHYSLCFNQEVSLLGIGFGWLFTDKTFENCKSSEKVRE